MSIDQDRARLAFQHVSEVLEPERKEYATLVHKLPALLARAGVCQSLHFLKSRDMPASNRLLEHLALQLKRVNGGITSAETLLARAREAPQAEYLRLTRESMATAAWYRRMVQGVLEIDMAAADGERS
ncbi:MAG: type III-B CRISPR module-associated protein Cmr5 [Deltaproteobacteria bacterium]|nr:type III-B CRISPR module-associated protein Cmr5 [Deltaproteobacteria bacterium]